MAKKEEIIKEQMDSGDAALPAFAAMDRVIPKLCTNIQISTLNKFIVISMFYSESPGQSTLIDRIAIDIEHAKKLSTVLNDVVEQLS